MHDEKRVFTQNLSYPGALEPIPPGSNSFRPKGRLCGVKENRGVDLSKSMAGFLVSEMLVQT